MNGKQVPLLLLLLLLLVGCASEYGNSEQEPIEATAPADTAAEEEAAPAVTPLPPPDPAAIAQSQLEQLQAAQLLYNPPAEMRAGVPTIVEARITHDTALPRSTLEAGLQGEGEPIVENIEVNSFVSVRLAADEEDFKITPRSSEEQIVAGTFTEWEWEVTPLKAGERALVLIVTARVKIPGFPDERKDLNNIERRISVQVNPGYSAQQFVLDNLEWITLGVLAPAVPWAWRRVAGRRRKEDEGGET